MKVVRWVVGAFIVLVAFGFVLEALGYKPSPTPASGGGGGSQPTVAAPTGPVTLLSLSGSGIKNSQTFTVTGPWTINYSYDCSSFLNSSGNFIVTVADSSGSPVEFPVNELGTKATSTSQAYSTGALHLEMNSECDWTVKATQP